MIEDLKLYYAKVIDINDPDQKGKIKIKILPHMKDIEENLLPWYDPFLGTGNNQELSFSPPEVGTNIFVIVESTSFRNGFYLSPTHIEGFFDYSGIKSSLNSVTELSSNNYPEIEFKRFNTGTIIFHNKINGDIGLLHSSGTYQIIDSNGYFYINQKDGNEITCNNTGIKIEDSNGNTFDLKSSGVSIEDSNGNSIDMGSTSVKINNNLEVLR